jgi:hypothetical protein
MGAAGIESQLVILDKITLGISWVVTETSDKGTVGIEGAETEKPE